MKTYRAYIQEHHSFIVDIEVEDNEDAWDVAADVELDGREPDTCDVEVVAVEEVIDEPNPQPV